MHVVEQCNIIYICMLIIYFDVHVVDLTTKTEILTTETRNFYFQIFCFEDFEKKNSHP